MIGKNYKLTFTSTSHQLVNKLVNHGFNIRDILNAGVVMFDKSTLESRGAAIAIAKTDPQRQFHDIIEDFRRVVKETDFVLLNKEDQCAIRMLIEVLNRDRHNLSISAAADTSDSAAACRTHYEILSEEESRMIQEFRTAQTTKTENHKKVP